MDMQTSLRISLFVMILKLSGCTTTSQTPNDEGYSSVIFDKSNGDLSPIPPRARKSLKGSEFAKNVKDLGGDKREELILRELRRGNMPNFLRSFQAIKVNSTIQGKTVQATYWVTPDYLAIGSDDDFFYIPMTPITAQKVADHFGFLLPTRKIVNDIYKFAEVKLAPHPLKPSPAMVTSNYYSQHQAVISDKLPSNHHQLIAGHKKDIVLTNKLCQQRHRVAIYGWHQPTGKPIQPLSLVHGDQYTDYSHGVRLVASMMIVDGVIRPVVEVLEDPLFSILLSDEGPLRQIRIATDCRSCS